MTTLVKYLRTQRTKLGWFCDKQGLLGKTARELYDGTGHPEFWVVILGCTQPDLAGSVLLQFVKNAVVPGSELEEIALGLDEGLELRIAHQRLKALSSEGTFLNDVLLDVVRFFINKKPSRAAKIILNLKQHYLNEGMSEKEICSTLYSFLHSEVSFDIWKGNYS